MKKNQQNERQWLADAQQWFQDKYHASPKECGITFIKIWYKPTPLKTTAAVVFAHSEEDGRAFMWEQNVLFRSIKYLWIAPLLFIATLFLAVTQDKSTAISVTALFCILCVGAILLCFYLARKCKKLEAVHQWAVDVYYP